MIVSNSCTEEKPSHPPVQTKKPIHPPPPLTKKPIKPVDAVTREEKKEEPVPGTCTDQLFVMLSKYMQDFTLVFKSNHCQFESAVVEQFCQAVRVPDL